MCALSGRLATVGVLQSARPGPPAQSVAPAGRITCGAMPGRACAAPVRPDRPPLEARPRRGRDVWSALSVIGATGRTSNTSAEQARTTMRVGRKRPMPVNHVERIPNTAETGSPHVPRARQSASLPVETRTHTPHVRLVSRDIVATVPAPRPSVWLASSVPVRVRRARTVARTLCTATNPASRPAPRVPLVRTLPVAPP